jgi:hypothetical protein
VFKRQERISYRIPAVAAVTLAVTGRPFGAQAEADSGQARGSDDSSANRARASFRTARESSTSRERGSDSKANLRWRRKEYPSFIGDFSKGLPHNLIGQVDRAAYLSFVEAVREGTAEAFERVPLGGNARLFNPLAGAAFDLEGTDSHQLAIPFPSVTSRELADQAGELLDGALPRCELHR